MLTENFAVLVETELMGLRKPRKRGGSPECKVREVGTSLNPPSKGSRNRANGNEEVKKKRRKPGMKSTGGWDIADAIVGGLKENVPYRGLVSFPAQSEKNI